MTDNIINELTDLQMELNTLSFGLASLIRELPDFRQFDGLDYVPSELEELKEKLEEAFDIYSYIEAIAQDYEQ